MLTEKQIERYSRQISIGDIGEEGQMKLLSSKVLIIGAGGLGSPCALYLASAGTGTIGIADSDTVELSNLNRQILHFSSDINKNKVDSARDKVLSMNPGINVKTYDIRVNRENISALINDYDFIVDATDNFESKFLINDACVINGKSFSHAGVHRFGGQTFTYSPGHSCYRCLYSCPPENDDPPGNESGGIIGFVPGIIGSIQSGEAVRYILGTGDLLLDRILIFDGLRMDFRFMKTERDKHCPVCGDFPEIKNLSRWKFKL